MNRVFLLRLLHERRGVSSVEYALLLFGILLVVAGGYRALGKGNVKAADASTREILGGTGYVNANASNGSSASGGGDGVVCDGRSCGVPGGNCFVAGTPVWTPSGERPIESIASGDIVFSRDEASGEVRRGRVVQTFARVAASIVDVVVVSQANAIETLRVTGEHRFWTEDRGWAEAETLTRGEALVDVAGEAVRVVSVTAIPIEAAVYNFEVADTHTYFVGHSKTWVHNACDPILPVFQGLQNGQIPSVSAQIFTSGIANGTIPPSGVTTYSIDPSTGAIRPSAPTSWVGGWFGGGSSTFTGQYIGLLTQPNGNAAHDVDPNAQVVFTDNLTGCAVAISPGSPPRMQHMLCSNLGDNPADYAAAIGPAMQAQGIDPNSNPPPLVVTADQYGWTVGGGDYGPGINQAPNANAFLYGVNDPATNTRKWYLISTGANPNGGGYTQTITPVGATNN